MLTLPTNVAQDEGPALHPWWKDWRGQTAAIVGAGPSAKSAGVDQLRGHAKVVVVNESYQLCPWADVLYGCDVKWWNSRNPQFDGLKLCYDSTLALFHVGINKIMIRESSDVILVDKAGVVGAGGCSGFQALNLAVQFGARKILLVGFDMRSDLDTHWHGRHLPPCGNPSQINFDRWKKSLDGSFEKLTTLGVRVINCSPVSTLTSYPKMTIAEALR
jgi:hypothetical protein